MHEKFRKTRKCTQQSLKSFCLLDPQENTMSTAHTILLPQVVRLIKKQRLKEPEGAMVEDALCLAFLEHQLPEFRLKETREKTVDILRKTWLRKMSEAGRAAALQLPLGAEEASLVSEALGSSS